LRTQASSLEFKFASCHQQGHVGSKTALQQNPPVLKGKKIGFLYSATYMVDQEQCT